MSDILIIAPTHTYKRGALRKEINDTIKDYSGAIRAYQKLNCIIPNGTIKTTAECRTAKMYLDTRPRDSLVAHQKEKAEEIFALDTLYENHPMHGISFPIMDGTNNAFIKGLSKL